MDRLAGTLHSALLMRPAGGAAPGPPAVDLSDSLDTATAEAALAEGRALADILVQEKKQYDLCVLSLHKALQSLTISGLAGALAEADSKCSQYGFTLGDEHNMARYELSRLKREEVEAAECARQLEREDRQRKTAAEAAKRALLDEEERVRLEMEEKERVDKEIAEKVAAAQEMLDISLLTAQKAQGVSPGARSIESFDACISSLEGALQQAQQSCEDGKAETPARLAEAMERCLQALQQHKQSRASFRINLASSAATIDDYTFLDAVLAPDNAADQGLADPVEHAAAVQKLADLRAQRQTRSKAQQMLAEAMESGSLAQLEKSLSYSQQAGYATLTAAVAASSMLASMKKTALEEEIDAAMAASHVGDFVLLEGLLSRVDEQKSLGVDAGKVLLMKQKLRELGQRRAEQDECVAALRAFLEVHAAFASFSSAGPLPEAIPEDHLGPLAASMLQLQVLLSQAETLGLGASAREQGGQEACEVRETVEAGKSMLHILRCMEATSLLVHCIAGTFEVAGIEHLVKLLEQGQRLKIAPMLLQQGNALLDALVSVKILRKNVVDGLDRAMGSAEPSIAALECALEQVRPGRQEINSPLFLIDFSVRVRVGVLEINNPLFLIDFSG